jgi:cation-transporting ATPase E
LVFGAPDTLLDPADAAHAAALARVEALTAEGARVVVLARAPAGLGEVAAGTRPAPLVALALVAIQDEIRPDIAETIRALIEHGVDVKVISGDHPHTVASVAARAGIPTAPVATEAELARLSGAAFEHAVRETVIFARITPETKKLIIASSRVRASTSPWSATASTMCPR